MDNEIEVMRVLRVPPMGKLVVEIKQQRFELLSEVNQPNYRQVLLAAIGELITFAGGYEKLVDAGLAPPVTPPKSAASPQDESADLKERQQAFLEQLERQRDAMKAASSEAKAAPAAPLIPRLEETRPQPVASARPLSIVEQIDAVLQKHLQAEPHLANRSIHLQQAPTGGLRIEIDGKYYQRPAEIEEKEVQLLIKMALKEWESN